VKRYVLLEQLFDELVSQRVGNQKPVLVALPALDELAGRARGIAAEEG
jgi:hypothetical protein